MSRWMLPLALAALAGCNLGFGSAYVGQWRAHQEVEFEVCLEDEQGRCVETRSVVTEHPAREFWGVAMTFPSIGGSRTFASGLTYDAFRLEGSLEILRGQGRYAYGVRSSVIADLGETTSVALPITAMGHVGLSERFSAYAGLGWSPHTRIESTDRVIEGTSRSVVRALGGLQIVINRTHGESRFFSAFEIDHMRSTFGDLEYRSLGLMSHLGVSF